MVRLDTSLGSIRVWSKRGPATLVHDQIGGETEIVGRPDRQPESAVGGTEATTADREAQHRSGWVPDIIVGGLLGAVTAAVVVINLIIWAGPDQGYESTPGEVFDHSALLGVVAAAILVGGALLGVVVARSVRRRRSGATATR